MQKLENTIDKDMLSLIKVVGKTKYFKFIFLRNTKCRTIAVYKNINY